VPDADDHDGASVQVPGINCPISSESKTYLESVYTRDIILASDSHAILVLEIMCILI
jgi:hypothetical protein